MKRNDTNIVMVFVCAIILLVAIFSNAQPTTQFGPKAVKGTLDLTKWDFQTEGIIDLKGEWLFYPNTYAAEQIGNGIMPADPQIITLPITLNQFRNAYPSYDPKIHGTLVLHINLPKDVTVYGIKTNLMLTAYELYVNNRLKATVGTLGTSAEDTVQRIEPTESFFDSRGSQLTLVYQVADYALGDMTMIAPKFGLAEQVSKADQRGIARDLFLFGALFIIGLYHLGLFFTRREDKASLYFGMMCLAFSFRMLLVGERYLTEFVTLNLMLHIRLCYLMIILGAIGLFGFMQCTFSDLFKPWLLKATVYLSGLFLLALMVLDYLLFEKVMALYLAFIAIMLLYVLGKLFIGIKEKLEGSALVFLGLFSLLLTILNDVIFQYTVANRPSMIPVGIFVFILCQSIALSAKFSKNFQLTEALSLENEKMVMEITEVNRSLEARVDERTKELQEAICNLERMSKTDHLTQLPNRRSIFEHMEKWEAAGKHFYVMLADIDDFKRINDTYGHDIGDKTLLRVSTIMSEVLGTSGIVGRWGGEEFMVIMEDNHNADALKIADELRHAIETMSHKDLFEHGSISITLGVCYFDECLSLTQCIHFADEALYKGKAYGKNRVVMYTCEEVI